MEILIMSRVSRKTVFVEQMNFQLWFGPFHTPSLVNTDLEPSSDF